MVTAHPLDPELLAAHARGLSQRDAAEAVGLSQRWVCKRLKALGLPPNGYRTPASRAKRSESVRQSWALRSLRSPAAWCEVFRPAGGLATPDGYALFGALCRAGWPVHDAAGVRLFGTREGLLCRCPAEVSPLLAAAPDRLKFRGKRVRLGAAEVRPVPKCRSAEARLVVVKGFTEPGPFAEAVRRQLDALGIGGAAEVGERRVVRVRQNAIVGFGLRVSGLTPAAGARLLARGVGGRQRFGCGVFLPC